MTCIILLTIKTILTANLVEAVRTFSNTVTRLVQFITAAGQTAAQAEGLVTNTQVWKKKSIGYKSLHYW